MIVQFRKAALGFFATANLMAVSSQAIAADEQCKLQRFVEMPMEENESFSPVVTILIDDQPRKFLLDTGGFWSLINPSITTAYKSRKAVISGFLGLNSIPLIDSVKVGSVQLGTAKFRIVEFYVAPIGYLHWDGALGANWLRNFDVEIDPVKNTASLFSKDHCEGQVVYWPHDDLTILPVDRDPSSNHLTIPLILDGKEITAVIDTGSPETYISRRAAERLFDLKDDSPGMQLASSGTDDHGHVHKSYHYRFQTLSMGDITFKNPILTVADSGGSVPDMILGMHQLHALHLYFAYGEEKLYVSTARGDLAAETTAGKNVVAAQPLTDPLNRTNARDMRETAIAALRKGDLDAAMVAIERAITIDPTYAAAFLTRAAIYAGKGNRELVFKDIDQAIAVDPKNPDGYAERARFDWLVNDRPRALLDVGQAIQIDPRYVPGYLQRAAFEFTLGQREAAIADATQAVRIDPKNAAVYEARGEMFARAGDYHSAYDDADTAVRLQPKSHAALNNRCWYGAILGNLDKAIDDCDAALDIAPNDPSALDSRGFVQFKRGRLDRSLADYTAAIAGNPKSASSLYGRAMVKQQKGDAAGAAADIAAAKAIDPDIAEHFGK